MRLTMPKTCFDQDALSLVGLNIPKKVKLPA